MNLTRWATSPLCYYVRYCYFGLLYNITWFNFGPFRKCNNEALTTRYNRPLWWEQAWYWRNRTFQPPLSFVYCCILAEFCSQEFHALTVTHLVNIILRCHLDAINSYSCSPYSAAYVKRVSDLCINYRFYSVGFSKNLTRDDPRVVASELRTCTLFYALCIQHVYK